MPVISNENTITIPKELLDSSNLNISKPVYLYFYSGHEYYLSNRKTRSKCLGELQIDDNLTITLSNNTIKTVKTNTRQYVMYLDHGTICINFGDKYFSHYPERFKDIKVQFPTEFMNMGNIDFNRPIYLNKGYSSYSYYISNRKRSDFCLGRLYLDNENFFTLSSNACAIMKIFSDDSLYWIMQSGEIYCKY